MASIKTFLDCTYLQFNGKFYKQIKGAPMGFCTSPFFANIVLETLEKNALRRITASDCIFYKRYVDDVLLIIKKNKIDETLKRFNNFNKDLQFTCEMQEDDSLNFLDLTLKRNENKIITDWFQKPTASHRLINFFSHHPIQQKKAIIFNLIDRAIKLSDPSFHDKNLKIVKKTLILNNYPPKFFEKYIKIRMNKIKFSDSSSTNSINNDNDNSNGKIILPFITHLSSKINNKLKKKCKLLIVNRNINKFNRFIKLGKDKLLTRQRSNIIYKINCKTCKKKYIGQSKRYLHVRCTEHKNAVTKKKKENAIYQHVQDTGHSIDFENAQILDTEAKLGRRRLSEMLHIHYNAETMNNVTDTNYLKSVYKKTVECIRNVYN